MADEVALLKLVANALLFVVALQLTGVRGWCVPPAPAANHDCCPSSPQSPKPSVPAIPDCCLAAALNFQSSITEVRSAGTETEAVQRVEHSLPDKVTPELGATARAFVRVPQPLLPPLSPLHQSCLLLI